MGGELVGKLARKWVGGNDQLGIAELKIYWGRCRVALSHIAQATDRIHGSHTLIVIESPGKAMYVYAFSWREPLRDRSPTTRKLLSIFTISENFLTLMAELSTVGRRGVRQVLPHLIAWELSIQKGPSVFGITMEAAEPYCCHVAALLIPCLFDK